MSFIDAKIVGTEVNPDEYHKIDTKRGEPNYPVSSTVLKNFNRCPSRWRNGYESPESKSTRFGQLLDCLVLTPDAFKTRFALRPDTYVDAKGVEKEWHHASNTCKEWLANHDNLNVISSTELSDAMAAARAVNGDERVSAMLAESDTQVWLSGFWVDEATGVRFPVRSLLDFVPAVGSAFYKNLGDLKTTRNAMPLAWARMVFDLGYHIQAAFNFDLYRSAKPDEDRCNFCHIMVENYPPFQVGRRVLSESFIELGRATYRRALANYAHCLKNGHWPDYDETDEASQGWTITEPAPWMEAHELNAVRYADTALTEILPEDELIP